MTMPSDIERIAEGLPPSLAVLPNIAHSNQTLDELRAELAYWEVEIASYTCWGAGLAFADSCRKTCKAWIERREREYLGRGRVG